MTWTYSSTNLSTDLAKVRSLVGDTDTNDQQLTDEEIDFYLDNACNLYYAAANASEALAGKYQRRVDKSVGRASLAASQRAKGYREQAASLRAQAAVYSGITPYVGGISESDKDAIEDDSDRVRSEEHTSELQSQSNLVCRLLLEKK